MPNTDPYRASFTIPENLHVDGLTFDQDLVTIHASTESPTAKCPLCGILRAGFMVSTLVRWLTYRGRASRYACVCGYESSSATTPLANAGSSPSV
jgi:hypothetical protein